MLSLEEPAFPLASPVLTGATAPTYSFSCAHFLRSFMVSELPTSCRQIGVHIVAAEAGYLVRHGVRGAVNKTYEHDERHDADDDAEHRERGAHLI